MHMNKLVYFISVAENLNFTKAAQECHLAQPAISQQINSLEDELGFKLLIRSSKNVELTEAGKVFYEEVKNVVEGYKNAVKKAESMAYGYTGVIRIGICGGTEEVFLSRIIKEFRKMYPLIEVEFKRASLHDISKQLENKIYDLVFTWPYDIDESKKIGNKVIFEDEVCAMISQSNDLSNKSSVSREELALENNIMLAYEEKTKTYKHFLDFYNKYGLKPKSILPVADSQILKLMIELNLGISIIPKRFRELQSNRFSYVEIEGKPHKIKFSIAYLKENTNPCVELFVNNASIR